MCMRMCVCAANACMCGGYWWAVRSTMVVRSGGCMHFIAGSHRRPEQVLAHLPAPNQTMNPLTELSFNELQVATGSDADSWDSSTPVPLPAGGAAFWLPRTLHGSARNVSPTPRKALLMSASCDPTPLPVPFERPWRSEVRAGQTGDQQQQQGRQQRRRQEEETGLDPNGAAGTSGSGTSASGGSACASAASARAAGAVERAAAAGSSVWCVFRSCPDPALPCPAALPPPPPRLHTCFFTEAYRLRA